MTQRNASITKRTLHGMNYYLILKGKVIMNLATESMLWKIHILRQKKGDKYFGLSTYSSILSWSMGQTFKNTFKNCE